MNTIKKTILFIVISAFLPFTLSAEWIPLTENSKTNASPRFTILSEDNSGMEIKVDISGFQLNSIEQNGKTYQSVDLLTNIFTNEAGSPHVPYLAKVLAVPDHAGISVEVIATSEIQKFSNIDITAVLESWFENEGKSTYYENEDIYMSNNLYPSVTVSSDKPAVFRDFRIVRVSAFPIRYIPAKNEIQAVSSITLRVNYNSEEVINPKTTAKKKIAPSFAKLYRSFIYNYEEVLNREYNGREDGTEHMLCIMPDEFVESFQPYAEWKRQGGTEIYITEFSDIGANANNPNIIKDHILDAYSNWENPPTYVCIVGDDGVFPKKIVNYDYSFPNEDFFVELIGDDYFPELMIGRLTNQGDYRLRVILNKLTKYEKEPYIEETDWFKKAICCSNNAYESQVETKRFAAQQLLEYGGYTSVDTLMSDGYWNDCTVDLDDVLNALNEGRGILNYRGEGWSDGWWASCYQFGTSSVSTLNNAEKFTFITSIGCGVAMFDAWEGNCFGEEWLQLGTLENPRGGIGFVGPTSNTHTAWNNRIDKGIYIGMFQEGLKTPGEALLRGKLYLYGEFGDDLWTEYHFRVFTVLGDPSIHVWKDIPQMVNVEFPSTIPLGYSQLEVDVTSPESEEPVANALVCISSGDILSTGYTDTFGRAYVEITTETLDPLTITVRGGNVYPVQDTIYVSQSGEAVGLNGDPAFECLEGNFDEIINPNEIWSVAFTLKNWGIEIAENVQATLSTPNSEYLEIITVDPINYGDLGNNATADGIPFQFNISSNCPIGQELEIDLYVTSNTSEWLYEYYFTIQGCMLQYLDWSVNDEESFEFNYRMDPGETLDLMLSVTNIGMDVAPNVKGVLTSTSPYITIIDSIGTFGTVEIDAILQSTDDNFIVNVDSGCPVEYFADYSLRLYTEDGLYPYETMVEMEIPVAKPRPIDFTGPDSYGYYAYSSTDTIFGNAPTFNWVDIDGMGSPLLVTNTSNYTETVDLPFTFKYYGIEYEQIMISTDGWIAFGSGTVTSPVNHELPNLDLVSCMVAPFWDNLHAGYLEDGEILYYDDTPNHRFIVSWNGIAHYPISGTPEIETFQVILSDPQYDTTNTGDGEILFQYLSVLNAENNTIGIENHTQDVGLQYVYNLNFDSTSCPISSEFAIKFTTELPFGSPVGILKNPGLLVQNSILEQNYPNPFSDYTRINFTLSEAEKLTLRINSIDGRTVRLLKKGMHQPGQYSVIWDGTDEYGNPLCSGIYFYQIHTESSIETRKLFLLK